MTPHSQGFSVQNLGLGSGANPHEPESAASDDWFDGWYEAEYEAAFDDGMEDE